MKNITSFTQENALTLFNSADDFPVDFDLAWKWLGFARKDPAKRSLIGGVFEEGRDFRYSHNNVGIEKIDEKNARSINKKAGEQQRIWLTIDCFKTWGMMAATEKGKEIRKYFLECERKLKEITAIAPAQAKSKSLMDLSASQLYRLSVYLDAVESGLEVDIETIRGIDPVFVDIAPEAAWLAYWRVKAQNGEDELIAHDLYRQMYEWQFFGAEEEKRSADRDAVAETKQAVISLESTEGYLRAFDAAELVVSGQALSLAGSKKA